MSEEVKKGFREHLVAGARDILVISAVISLLFSIGVWLSRPYWEPFANLPKEMQELQGQVAEVQLSMSDRLRPLIINFDGPGIIVGPDQITPGQSVTILYFLRRNASCETDVDRAFYNVSTGVKLVTDTFRATKAPVTSQFILFKVDVLVPLQVPPGSYSYSPTLHPVDCGVYDQMQVPPSQVFEVLPLSR